MYVAIAASRKPRAARIDLTDGARARALCLSLSLSVSLFAQYLS